MADARTILLNLLGKETVSRAAKKAADGLDDLGDSADKATRDAKELDKQLADTEKSLHDITRALARDPGDSGLRKQLRDIRRESRFLQNVKKDFEGLGDDAGKGFVARFGARIGPLIASAPISPPLIGAVAGAAPAISSIVSGAIAGGAAVGAVGLGAALASRRTDVERAFGDVGDEIMSALTVDAGVMAEPMIEAAERGRAEFRKIRPDLQAVFADASRYVAPLTRGLAGAAKELTGGFREIVREGEPVVEMLEYQLPRAGRSTSNALKMVTADSEANAESLSTLFTALEISIEGTGVVLAGLNKVHQYTNGLLMYGNKLLTDSDRKQAEAAAAAEKLRVAEVRKAQAMHRSTEEIEGMNRALAEAPSEALEAEQANFRAAQSWDDLSKSIKEAGKDGKLTKQEFNDLYGQTLDYAGGMITAAEATRKQTGSQQAANVILDRGRTNFLAAAKAANIEATAAQQLADKLFGIPGQRTTKINVNKQQAEKDLAAINRQANSAARTRYLNIIAHYTSPSQSGALGAVGQIPREKGGPVRQGEAYIVGEKRPEVFVPNQDGMIYPDVGKFTGQLGRAASAPATVRVELVGPEVVKSFIRKIVVVDGGGSVQAAFGR